MANKDSCDLNLIRHKGMHSSSPENISQQNSGACVLDSIHYWGRFGSPKQSRVSGTGSFRILFFLIKVYKMVKYLNSCEGCVIH